MLVQSLLSIKALGGHAFQKIDETTQQQLTRLTKFEKNWFLIGRDPFVLSYLKDSLEKLGKSYGIIGMKQSFEDEGVLLDDVITVKRITELCEMQSYVKIGGCEAKSDLYNCVRLGINGVIAPMVETPFALSKFLDIIKDYDGKIDPYIVIESKTAYENVDDILKVYTSRAFT